MAGQNPDRSAAAERPSGEGAAGGRPKVFLSYRRTGTAAHAFLLHECLKQRFGAENMFLDVAELQGDQLSKPAGARESVRAEAGRRPEAAHLGARDTRTPEQVRHSGYGGGNYVTAAARPMIGGCPVPAGSTSRWTNAMLVAVLAVVAASALPTQASGRAADLGTPGQVLSALRPALNAFWTRKLTWIGPYGEFRTAYRAPTVTLYGVGQPIRVPRACDDDGRPDGLLHAARGRYTAANWRSGRVSYCSPSRSVYLDRGVLTFFISRIDDYAAGILVVHEWSHHVQYLMGIDGPTRYLELQADCFAGAFTAFATQVGIVDGNHTLFGDYFLSLIGDDAKAWWDAESHGTGRERSAAFETGFTYGVGRCW
jgi:hypothetical protein